MPNYGLYFGVLVAPTPEQRRGRYITGADVIPIGAPVSMVAQAANLEGRNEVALATGDTPHLPGREGLAIFEWAYNAYAGFDPVLRHPSDFPDILPNSPIQLVSGHEIKVVFRNIAAATNFPEDGGRVYDDVRTMVAGIEDIDVGDILAPGVGNATDGFWKVATSGHEDDGWFLVTNVDADRLEVEAQLLF